MSGECQMVNVTRQRRASREKPQGAPAAGRGGGKWWEMRLHRRVKKDFNCPAKHRGLSWVKAVEHCRVQVRKSFEPSKAPFCQKERTLVPLPPARLADFREGAEASWCLGPRSRACSWGSLSPAPRTPSLQELLCGRTAQPSLGCSSRSWSALY